MSSEKKYSYTYKKVFRPKAINSFKGMTFEHDVVITKYINRSKPAGTVVHHRNQNKLDNRIENLLLLPCQAVHHHIHELINAGNTVELAKFERCAINFMNNLKADLPMLESIPGLFLPFLKSSQKINKAG